MASNNKEDSDSVIGQSQLAEVEKEYVIITKENTLSQQDSGDVEVLPEFSSKVSIEETEVIEIRSDCEVEGSGDCDKVEGEKHEDSDRSCNQSAKEIANSQQTEKMDDDSTIKDVQNSNVGRKYSTSTYNCNCGEHFEKSTELAAHKRWTCKMVEKKLQCEICKTWFVHERGLKRHMKHSHDGDFSCTRCDLRFHNRMKLTRHWMESHYDENRREEKLKCFLCGDDSFKGKFELESHLLVHKYNRLQTKKKNLEGRILQEGMARKADKTSETVMIDLTDPVDESLESFSVASNNKEFDMRNAAPTNHPLDYFTHRLQSHPLHKHHRHHHGHRHGHHPLHYNSETITNSQSNRHPDIPDDKHSSHSPQAVPPCVCCRPKHHHHRHPSPHHHHSPPHHHYPPPPHHYPPPPHHSTISTPPSEPTALHPPHSPPPSHHHPPPPSHHYPPHPPHHYPHPPHHSISSPPPSEHTALPPPPHHHPPPFFHHLRPFWPPTSQHDSPHPSWYQHPYDDSKCHSMKKHWKGKVHNKWKWKKYFKNMMSGYLPPFGFYPFSPSSKHQQDLHDIYLQPSHSSQSSTSTDMPITNVTTSAPDTEKEQNPDGNVFQMTCNFCDQVMESGKAKQHRLQECPVMPSLKCKVCDRVFKRPHKLIQHMKRHDHFPDADNPSATFGDTTSISSLQEKLNSVLDFQNRTKSTASSSETYSKPISEQQSEQLKSLEHLTVSGSSIPQLPECSRPGTSESVVNSVNKNDGPCSQEKDILKLVNVDNEMEEASLVIDEEEHSSKAPALQCLVCGIKFDAPAVLSVHLQAHITHVTAVQKVHEWKEKSSQYFSDSTTEEDSLAFSCADSTADAVSITTTDTSFQDTASSANFSSLGTIENSSEKASAVTVTDSEKWLKSHCKNRDMKEVYPCEFCNETFAFKKALHFHIKEKHSGKRYQLECPVCQKKFSWKRRGQFYERHLSSHYGVTIFKHKCEICDKTFLEKCKLQAHMALHKAEFLHKCDICGKGYGTKSSLSRHLRQHTGDKPHQCTECSESFLEKRELIRHMATHTGTPAFVCLQCGQGFTLKTSLDTHIKRKHPQLS